VGSESRTEVERLEGLWGGAFGDAYVDRNAAAGDGRADFWRHLLTAHAVTSVLEVGCNVGANLRHIAGHVDSRNVHGVDVNLKALERLHASGMGVNAIWAPARELPFRDRWFDLVVTVGVLIHQPETTLGRVMDEIVRCARRYVLCAEYHADGTEEIPYRGEHGTLFRRNYRDLYLSRFPELDVADEGQLGADEGFDAVTWHLFERREVSA
jgi:pseudaminic acid biosynthesis-associated methylase